MKLYLNRVYMGKWTPVRTPFFKYSVQVILLQTRVKMCRQSKSIVMNSLPVKLCVHNLKSQKGVKRNNGYDREDRLTPMNWPFYRIKNFWHIRLFMITSLFPSYSKTLALDRGLHVSLSLYFLQYNSLIVLKTSTNWYLTG